MLEEARDRVFRELPRRMGFDDTDKLHVELRRLLLGEREPLVAEARRLKHKIRGCEWRPEQVSRAPFHSSREALVLELGLQTTSCYRAWHSGASRLISGWTPKTSLRRIQTRIRCCSQRRARLVLAVQRRQAAVLPRDAFAIVVHVGRRVIIIRIHHVCIMTIVNIRVYVYHVCKELIIAPFASVTIM